LTLILAVLLGAVGASYCTPSRFPATDAAASPKSWLPPARRKSARSHQPSTQAPTTWSMPSP